MRSERGPGARDLLLPLVVVAVVGMMIFPLPCFVLDFLLICNITFSLVLLVSAVYLSEPEKFTSLPTILLLTTLFRLGLNISTTRQLLANGEAPDVVIAFGEFVVEGNLIVGIVVFAIVTLVQFLVIAKGAERVAEVAARFTLDAMPGKQMSIDADVRSGILSLAEARERRRELQRESKLFGALDGAMKFVKGDAIAGLIITLINISAGLILGVTQQGLELATALHKYSLFTIGDGLVSQIPALLVAVSAGIAVTRVSDKEGSFVGRDVFSQLAREPQALGTTGGVLVALSLVPGLPMWLFVGMGMMLMGIAHSVSRKKSSRAEATREAEFRPKLSTVLGFRISAQGVLALQRERTLPKAVQELRMAFFERRGVLVPDIQFEVDRSIPGANTAILLHGIVVERIEAESSGAGAESFALRIIHALTHFLESNLVELIDDTQTRTLFETHQGAHEDLINSVVPSMISVTGLTKILRQLVKEGVSIREFGRILQATAEFNLAEAGRMAGGIAGRMGGGDPEETPGPGLLSAVRTALKRTLSQDVADRQGRVAAYLLSPELDKSFSAASLCGEMVEPEVLAELLAEVNRLKAKSPSPLTVITSRYARLEFANTVLNAIGPTRGIALRALCMEEISSELQLDLVGELSATHREERAAA